MTTILLDPSRPDVIPAAAAGFLSGPVHYTPDVPVSVVWELPQGIALLADDDAAPVDGVLMTTDPQHPAVQRHMANGGRVISMQRRSGATLIDAVALIDRLRVDGPWEREQTHESLRRYLLEEAYETLDAIASGSHDHLREELADLLLQVLFHARIAADDVDGFDIDDVARTFIDKISGRTRGVLNGGVDLATQIEQWEQSKSAEKQRDSSVDGIPTDQPALLLAQKVLERIAAAGYPAEDIPAEVTTVSLAASGDGENAEDGLRSAVLDLMARVRVWEGRQESAADS